MRQDLGVEEGTGFWMYSITDEGILLKKVDAPELSSHEKLLSEVREKSAKIKVSRKNVDESEKKYKKTKKGRLELV